MLNRFIANTLCRLKMVDSWRRVNAIKWIIRWVCALVREIGAIRQTGNNRIVQLKIQITNEPPSRPLWRSNWLLNRCECNGFAVDRYGIGMRNRKNNFIRANIVINNNWVSLSAQQHTIGTKKVIDACLGWWRRRLQQQMPGNQSNWKRNKINASPGRRWMLSWWCFIIDFRVQFIWFNLDDDVVPFVSSAVRHCTSFHFHSIVLGPAQMNVNVWATTLTTCALCYPKWIHIMMMAMRTQKEEGWRSGRHRSVE